MALIHRIIEMLSIDIDLFLHPYCAPYLITLSYCLYNKVFSLRHLKCICQSWSSYKTCVYELCACVELFWEALEEAAVSRRVCQVRDTWAELTLGYFGHPSALELPFLQAAATDNLFTCWQRVKHSAVHLWQGLKLPMLSRAWLLPLCLLFCSFCVREIVFVLYHSIMLFAIVCFDVTLLYGWLSWTVWKQASRHFRLSVFVRYICSALFPLAVFCLRVILL